MKISNRTPWKGEVDKFHKWVKDNTYIEKASAIKINPRTDKVLLEVFFITRKTSVFMESNIVKAGQAQQEEPKWFSVAKLLTPLMGHGGTVLMEAGTIVTLPNELCDLVENPEYDTVMKKNAAFPSEKRALPPQYLGENMEAWDEQYRFRFNPFDLKEEGHFYLAPSHNIYASVNIDYVPNMDPQ